MSYQVTERHGITLNDMMLKMLSDINKSEKAAYSMNPTIWHSGKGKITDTVKRSVVT